ncbi:MAG: AAA family ATPase [Nocardioides sp.]|nr:AAA family ATPase [Nocardioides sp.]
MAGLRGAASLLGRDEERAELYDALSLTLEATPQIVLVDGDAGIGKTALVSDLAQRAEELGARAVVGHCLDIDADIRMRSEAAFARLCGVAPLPASSGKTGTRHRLNSGGDRDANSALYLGQPARLEPPGQARCRETGEAAALARNLPE